MSRRVRCRCTGSVNHVRRFATSIIVIERASGVFDFACVIIFSLSKFRDNGIRTPRTIFTCLVTMNILNLKINGMHCDGCASRLQGLFERAVGVDAATVSFDAGNAKVTYNPDSINADDLLEITERGGFTAAVEQI